MHSNVLRKPAIGLLCAVMFAGLLVACGHGVSCASTLDTAPIVYTRTGGSSSSSSSHSSSSPSRSSSPSSSSPKSSAPSSNGSKTSTGTSGSSTTKTVAPSANGTKPTTSTGTSTSKAPTTGSKTVAPTANGSKTGAAGKTVAPTVNGSRVGSKANPVPSGSRPANNAVPKTNYSVSVGGTTHIYVTHNRTFYNSPSYRYVSTDPIFFNDPYDFHNFSNPLSPWFGIHPHYNAVSCY